MVKLTLASVGSSFENSHKINKIMKKSKDESTELLTNLRTMAKLMRGVTTLEQLGITDPTEKADVKRKLKKMAELLDQYVADAARENSSSSA